MTGTPCVSKVPRHRSPLSGPQSQKLPWNLLSNKPSFCGLGNIPKTPPWNIYRGKRALNLVWEIALRPRAVCSGFCRRPQCAHGTTIYFTGLTRVNTPQGAARLSPCFQASGSAFLQFPLFILSKEWSCCRRVFKSAIEFTSPSYTDEVNIPKVSI